MIIWCDIDSTLVHWDHKRAVDTDEPNKPILDPDREDLWEFNWPLVARLIQMFDRGDRVVLQTGGGPDYARMWGDRLQALVGPLFHGYCHKAVAIEEATPGDLIVDDAAEEMRNRRVGVMFVLPCDFTRTLEKTPN